MNIIANENGVFLVEENTIVSESSNHLHINISNRIVRQETKGVFVEYIRPLNIWCKKHLKPVCTTNYKPFCCKSLEVI
jgi:hypothetical protein